MSDAGRAGGRGRAGAGAGGAAMRRLASAPGVGRDVLRPVPDAESRSLVPAAAWWVSGDAVRQAIGALAYTLGAGERRPDPAEVREAIGVASAVRELQRQRLAWAGSDPAGEPPAIAADADVLGALAGLARPAVAGALRLLERSGVLVRAAVGEVALAPVALAPQPTAAALDWDAVRRRLAVAGGSVPAALAVLRELAATAGAGGVGAAGAVNAGNPAASDPIRLSVRALEERTGYGRSTVAEALAALERARVVDVEARVGRTARFTLRPAAFGAADLPPVAPEASGVPARLVDRTGLADRPMEASDDGGWGAPSGLTSSGATVGAVAAAPAATPAAVATPPSSATAFGMPAVAPAAAAPAMPAATPLAPGAPVRLGEFAGIPIHAPPGTPLVVECDAAGRWTCRVGPFLVLGPVGPER